MTLGLLAAASGLLLLAADLVPAAWPGSQAARAARAALSPTCHQIPARSFVLHGEPLAACARCAGLHASGLAGGLLLAMGWPRRLPPAGVLMALGTSPMVLDWAAGAAWPTWDHAWLRAATGILAGTCVLLSAGVAGGEPRQGHDRTVPEKA